jgi:hypothetical protein
VVTEPSPSIRFGEVEFIVKNQVDDITLMLSICHVPRGGKDSNFSPMILPMCESSVKVKTSLSSAGSVECCLVYELINQRNESEPVMEDHQVFIAVRVFARPLTNKYKASVAMFMARNGQFTGGEGDMKRLKKSILRKHLVNNTYSFECAIKARILKLETAFHPDRQTIIDVTLKETTKYTDERPVLFE